MIITFIILSSGTKTTSAAVTDENDELKLFSDARITSTAEAMWYVLGYPMHKQSPGVQRLGCSSTYNPQVCFDPDLEPEDIEASVQMQLQLSPSHLKSWFILNTTDHFARTLAYIDIPSYYTWDELGRWKRRIRPNSAALGRLYPVDPTSQEQWALRLLLLHVKGCQCEADIRTVFGEERLTFVAAAMAAGLLEDDSEYIQCLKATAIISGQAMRDLLMIILIHCQPRDPTALITTFFEDLVDDWLGSPEQKLQQLLQLIANNTDTSLDALGVDFPAVALQNGSSEYLESFVSNPAVTHFGCLNAEQLSAHDAIIADIEINASQRAGTHVFTLMAAAGTGKTFLINSILQSARLRDLRVVPSASSALAASLLGHARTSKCVLLYK
jgi:hypothetical protein